MGPRFRGDDAAFCIRGHAMNPHVRPGVIAAVAVLAARSDNRNSGCCSCSTSPAAARVKVTPFFDLVLAWNVGISFGWFQNDSQLAQISLMIIKAVAVIVLAIWMARSRTLLATIALGLIIGGAIGNGIGPLRLWRGGRFSPCSTLQIGGNTYNWYVFNLADVAIVAGGSGPAV